MNRYARNTGLAVAITGILGIAALHAACELALSSRNRVEAWQAKRAYGRIRPIDWHWPGMPR